MRLLPFQKGTFNTFSVRGIALSTFGSPTTRIYRIVRLTKKKKKSKVRYLKMSARRNSSQFSSLLAATGKLLRKKL